MHRMTPARLYCAGSFGAAFVKLLRPLVLGSLHCRLRLFECFQFLVHAFVNEFQSVSIPVQLIVCKVFSLK